MGRREDFPKRRLRKWLKNQKNSKQRTKSKRNELMQRTILNHIVSMLSLVWKILLQKTSCLTKKEALFLTSAMTRWHGWIKTKQQKSTSLKRSKLNWRNSLRLLFRNYTLMEPVVKVFQLLAAAVLKVDKDLVETIMVAQQSKKLINSFN